MEENEFKNVFGQLAEGFHFAKAFGGFLKESNECIVVLELQKSKYGKYYDINLKIFIQDLFGIQYQRNKDLVKKDIGTVFVTCPFSIFSRSRRIPT